MCWLQHCNAGCWPGAFAPGNKVDRGQADASRQLLWLDQDGLPGAQYHRREAWGMREGLLAPAGPPAPRGDLARAPRRPALRRAVRARRARTAHARPVPGWAFTGLTLTLACGTEPLGGSLPECYSQWEQCCRRLARSAGLLCASRPAAVRLLHC